jgi:hypothetical protein
MRVTYIRKTMPCQQPGCLLDAALDADWRPGAGYHFRIRRYRCLFGHDSYRVITRLEWLNEQVVLSETIHA